MSTSANGLFRATGKKSKPVAVRNLDGSYEKTDQLEREADDFYPTPPEPTRALLVAEQERLKQFPLIWEPSCGDGAMVREIEAAGHACFGSDLIDRNCGADLKSFYDYSSPVSRAVITNPPYQECNHRDGRGRWIWHSLDVLKLDYMALLLNWSWPGASGHARLWSDHPPARVYLMCWKIDFTGQGAPPMLNAWFVWDKAHEGETELRMLYRNSNPSQLELIENIHQGANEK